MQEIMKKPVKIVLGILGGIIALGITLFVVVFSILNKQKNADYYVLGNDQIVSVKTVIGVREISGVSTGIRNGVSTKTYHYKSETSTDDASQYVAYLVEQEGFVPTILNQQSDRPVYAKDSVDEGKILILTIVDTGFGYTLMIQKGEGALTISE